MIACFFGCRFSIVCFCGGLFLCVFSTLPSTFPFPLAVLYIFRFRLPEQDFECWDSLKSTCLSIYFYKPRMIKTTVIGGFCFDSSSNFCFFKDTNRNLGHLDHLLGQYREYNKEQTEAIATVSNFQFIFLNLFC